MSVILLIVLLAIVVVVGAGALLYSRARADRGVALEPPHGGGGGVAAPPAPPELSDEAVADIESALAPVAAESEAPTAELELEAEPLVRPRLRDRLARARATLAGAFGSVRSRDRIDDETWDDL